METKFESTSIKKGTRLEEIQTMFNAQLKARGHDLDLCFTTFLNIKLKRALVSAKGEVKNLDKDMPTGFATFKTSYDQTPKSVSVGMLCNLISGTDSLKELYPNTVFDFIADITACEKEMKTKQSNRIKEKAVNSNMIRDRFLGKLKDGKWKWSLLNSNTQLLIESTTAVEQSVTDRFAYAADDETRAQLYWKFDTGYSLIPLDVHDASAVSVGDGQFMQRFYTENKSSITKAISAVFERAACLIAYDDDGLGDVTFDDVCPRYLQQCLSLGRFYEKTEDDGYVKTDKFKVSIRRGATSSSAEEIEISRGTLIPMMAKKLIADLDRAEVKRLRKFSNDPSGGLYFIGCKPIHRRDLINEPKLADYNAPTWDKFLKNKFPSPKMSLYRLAAFTLSVRDADNYSRQCLTCVGAGNDGKSVLMSALAGIVGVGLVKSGASVRDLDNTNTFGVMDFVDKRLICFDDMQRGDLYKIFNSERFKSITGAGAGAIEVNVKYARPIQWKPCGAKVIMASNFGTILSDDSMTTRCLPLAFNKNYEPDEIICPNELVNNLVQERAGFLQWCADYTAYYNNRCNVNGERPRLNVSNVIAILSDNQYDDWFEAKEGNVWIENSHETVRRFQKEAFEEITTVDAKDVPFIQIRNSTGDNSAYAEDSVWDDLARILVEPTDNPNDVLTMKELKTAIITMGAKLKKDELGLSQEDTAIVKESGICNVPPEKLKYSAAYKTLLKTIYRVFECEQFRGVRTRDLRDRGIKPLAGEKGLAIKYGKEAPLNAANKNEKSNFDRVGLI